MKTFRTFDQYKQYFFGKSKAEPKMEEIRKRLVKRTVRKAKKESEAGE